MDFEWNFAAISNWTSTAYDDVVAFASDTGDTATDFGSGAWDVAINVASWFNTFARYSGKSILGIVILLFLWVLLKVGMRYYLCASECLLQCRARQASSNTDAEADNVQMTSWRFFPSSASTENEVPHARTSA